MMKLITAATVAALVSFAVPATAMPAGKASGVTSAGGEIVLVKHHGGHGWKRHGRGHHYGWHRGRGHHYGWHRGHHRRWH